MVSDGDYLLKQIFAVVKKAGNFALEFYDQDFFTAKEEEFPVTKADIEINKILTDGLSKIEGVFVFSEEQKESKEYLNKESYFIVDPIDGTKDFVHKTGGFCIMLALIKDKQPVIGVVYKPVGNELFYAVKNKGAYLEKDGKSSKINVDKQSSFSDMKMVMSKFHLSKTEIEVKEKLGIFNYEQKGSAGLKMCDIAQGKAHLYINTSSKTGEWDSAPGSLIIQEAGGVITDIYGNTLEFSKKEPYNTNGYVVSNGIKHAEIIKVLQKDNFNK
jgi:3'(2'), 5'-bisphosphate nucleotidase